MKKMYHTVIATSGALFFMALLSTQASAEVTFDNVIGVGYQSGFNDISDFHEELGYDVSSISFIGLSYRLAAKFDNGARIDTGFGPVTIMTGDASYSDIPLGLTLGYTFLEKETFRPYIRGGFTYHINSGDYVETGAGFGMLGAVGCEIGNDDGVSFFAEVAYDSAEATMQGRTWLQPNGITEDVNVNALVVTMGVVF